MGVLTNGDLKKDPTPTERLAFLESDVKLFENKKIGKEKELELFKIQHTTLKKELFDLGIQDINKLPEIISEIEVELEEKLTAAEKEVKEIKESINGI